MGFCPYFLQDHISEDKPSAGTSQTLFIWLFLWENKQHNHQRSSIKEMGTSQISHFSNWEHHNTNYTQKIRRNFYLFLDLGLGVCEIAVVEVLAIKALEPVTDSLWCCFCFSCCLCCCCCGGGGGDRSCMPPRTERGEMGLLFWGVRVWNWGKKGLNSSCNSSTLSLLLGSNRSGKNRNWSSCGRKVDAVVVVAVAAEQLLTTACRSQSSAIPLLLPCLLCPREVERERGQKKALTFRG